MVLLHRTVDLSIYRTEARQSSRTLVLVALQELHAPRNLTILPFFSGRLSSGISRSSETFMVVEDVVGFMKCMVAYVKPSGRL